MENSSANIPFKLEGPAFEEAIPLHLMLGVLDEFHSIVDKTYLHFSEKDRLSKYDRQHYQLRVPHIKHGSAEAEIGLIITGVQTVMPFIQQIGPKGIWDYTKETFSFLKMIYDGSKRGEVPTYQNTGDGNLVVTTGGVSKTYNQCVFNIGQKSDQHYRKLTKALDKTGADNLRFGDDNDDAIKLTSEDVHRFDLDTTIDNNVKEIECEIFDFNKFEKHGLLQVHEDQDLIPAEVYKFTH